jgi:hypothetical protein
MFIVVMSLVFSNFFLFVADMLAPLGTGFTSIVYVLRYKTVLTVGPIKDRAHCLLRSANLNHATRRPAHAKESRVYSIRVYTSGIALHLQLWHCGWLNPELTPSGEIKSLYFLIHHTFTCRCNRTYAFVLRNKDHFVLLPEIKFHMLLLLPVDQT